MLPVHMHYGQKNTLCKYANALQLCSLAKYGFRVCIESDAIKYAWNKKNKGFYWVTCTNKQSDSQTNSATLSPFW